MSKVPITIDVERYVCTDLEELRKMYECRDFSGMLAAIERIQRHVNAMEDGLMSNKYKKLFESVRCWSYEEAEEYIKKSKEEKSKEKSNG